MEKLINTCKTLMTSLGDKLSGDIGIKFSNIKEIVNGLPIVVSLEKSHNFKVEYDEKHYFVIPFKLSETGFALHTMRCLPKSALEINDLPKRRVFHFPNKHYESALRAHMLKTAKELTIQTNNIPSSLERLADDIDVLDKKLTYGMIFVGGLAAIFNPWLGAGIAGKALLPSLSGLVNQYSLRPMGQKMTQYHAKKAAKSAEEHVIKQFSEANTLKVVNPILQELEFALRTSESKHDPLLDPNLADGNILELDNERWRELTQTAVYHIYKEVYTDPAKHPQAGLGPEDIRWLKTLFIGRQEANVHESLHHHCK